MPGHRDDGRRTHGCSATVIQPSTLVSAPAAPALTRFGPGFVLPGRSSLDGGIEEFPLFRETNRSNRRTRSSNTAFASRNRRTRAISSSRDSSSNPDTTQDHHSS
jgi:hypothetical protein